MSAPTPVNSKWPAPARGRVPVTKRLTRRGRRPIPMPVRSRDTSFFGARQVRFERPEERVDALDVVGVIALELHD